jgi:hypothetical protein
MENLESLSDVQLLSKCVEYGLPKLPITDTTRKVIIKKLKVKMEDQKVKSRRETVAITKFSSDEELFEEKPKSKAKTNDKSRRATVATTNIETPSKKTNGTTITNGKSPSRRTSRATPAKQLQEDSDDDIIEIPVISTRRSASRTTTPTLGISEVVRTAYKSSQPETVVEEYEYTEKQTEIEPIPKSSTRRKTITTSSNNPDRATPSNFRRTMVTTTYSPKRSDDDEPITLDEASTPYLSNFAKRLSTIKADKLDIGTSLRETRNYTPVNRADYPQYSESYAAASTYKTKQHQTAGSSGVMKGLKKETNRLVRSNQKLIIFAMLVLIVIAIYVLLYT